ncbi:MAG: YchF/TatD family DNA exonuclease [Rhodospirillaceae bacterium]|nr:YchF/TatD family DNA exonuclease [Rhodospirillaceae bacterium]MDD9997779.1 YchF/TatD family DNA exonuclease [Rhodospirillaceae bacterium]
MSDLIDIGVNLTHESFDRDRGDVLKQARDAGVRRLIVTGTSLTESVRALELARAFPGTLYSTAGVHPHNAAQFDEHTADALGELLVRNEVVAVGECGLDFYRDFSPRDAQRRAFQAQLEIAADVRLPVFLHQRDAHDELLELLRPVRSSLCGGVAHCFTGTAQMARDYLDMDLYIGITGWLCDERRGADLKDAVRHLPLDRVMIETDAPYLLPRDLPRKPRGRRNEPRFLPHILVRMAEAMNRSVDEVAEATRRNAEQLFSLPANQAGKDFNPSVKSD